MKYTWQDERGVRWRMDGARPMSEIGDETIAWLASIRAARDSVRAAEAMKCVCSGFCLQYEGGCQCDRGEAIKAANARLRKLIDAL